MRFSQATVEALGWYVYLLTDPRTRAVFYVGKGSGQRAFQHGAEARDKIDHPELQKAKHERILEIEAAGSDVVIEILRHGLPDEATAYLVEAAAIDVFNRLHPSTLLNLVAGHHSSSHGLTAAHELEIRYAAQPMPDPGIPVILTSLDRTWYRGIGDAELLEFTTRWWKLSRTLKTKPAYVIGVHRQLVRSVYRIIGMEPRKQGDRDWEDDLQGKPRHGFVVEPASELQHLIGTTVHGLLGRNPQWSVRYLKPEDFAARDAGLSNPQMPPT